MAETTNILTLIGSPKPKGSTSEALADYLTAALPGSTADKHHAHRVIRAETFTRRFLAALDEADLLVISFPLYVDSLPYVLTEVLELIAAHRAGKPPHREQRLFCIANCGFPEPEHSDIALAICRAFADEVGFTWAGSVAVGMGSALNGQPLDALGGMTYKIREGLDEAAAYLQAGEGTPPVLTATPMMPQAMYLALGTLGWHMQAKTNDAHRSLWARPYARE